MSWRWMAAALGAMEGMHLTPADRLTLVALADFADEAGLAWPSLPTLARRAGVSERGCRTAIRRLIASGLVEVAAPEDRGSVAREQRSRRYRLRYPPAATRRGPKPAVGGREVQVQIASRESAEHGGRSASVQIVPSARADRGEQRAGIEGNGVPLESAERAERRAGIEGNGVPGSRGTDCRDRGEQIASDPVRGIQSDRSGQSDPVRNTHARALDNDQRAVADLAEAEAVALGLRVRPGTFDDAVAAGLDARGVVRLGEWARGSPSRQRLGALLAAARQIAADPDVPPRPPPRAANGGRSRRRRGEPGRTYDVFGREAAERTTRMLQRVAELRADGLDREAAVERARREVGP